MGVLIRTITTPRAALVGLALVVLLVPGIAFFVHRGSSEIQGFGRVAAGLQDCGEVRLQAVDERDRWAGVQDEVRVKCGPAAGDNTVLMVADVSLSVRGPGVGSRHQAAVLPEVERLQRRPIPDRQPHRARESGPGGPRPPAGLRGGDGRERPCRRPVLRACARH